MSDVSHIIEHNQAGLDSLQRALNLGSGQFSLIIARVNYRRLQQILLAVLARTETFQTVTLYTSTTALRETLVKETIPRPQALMVTGFDQVKDLESLFKAANLGRDEFPKSFACPIVLWMTDPVLQALNQHAPDFKSFAAAPVQFDYPVTELVQSLHKAANELFADILDGNDDPLGSTVLHLPPVRPELRALVEHELPFALADLERYQATLDPDLWASLQFLKGRESHVPGEMDQARESYEQSLAHWLASKASDATDKQAVLLFHLGLWWRSYAVLQRPIYRSACEQAQVYFRETLDIFQQQQRPDRIAKFLSALAEVLQKLSEWDALEALAKKGLELHQGDLIRLARDYGYLAEASLARKDWPTAQQYAEQALEQAQRAVKIVTRQKIDEAIAVSPQAVVISLRYHQGWYHFLLGQAKLHQGNVTAALEDLEDARQQTSPSYDLPLFRKILETLQELYFLKQDYLQAFELKLERRRVENLFGLRAFIGASPIQPYHQTPYLEEPDQATLSAEMRASGRQQAVDSLVERLVQPRYPLVVIHGQSGVGKSSILKAGLVPTLRQTTYEGRLTVPVFINSFRDWEAQTRKALVQALIAHPSLPLRRQLPASLPPVETNELPNVFEIKERQNTATEAINQPSITAQDLLALFRQQTQVSYRQIILVFDQFEEFFFERPKETERNAFYQFLKACLDEPYIKVVLSLREDYLHYLLEWDRFADLEIINNDILSKEVRYYLGNFSLQEAEAVIRQLTENAQFNLEEDLINALVSDLAAERGDIRPIELQVVGAELQREEISTLSQYQQLGDEPKEQLVQNFLAQVIRDCGPENQTLAQATLYLLSDEAGTRPLKTFQELKESLALAGILGDPSQLKLVLQILAGSGMIFELPEISGVRYQLVHDYLADLIQRQDMPGLITALQEERRRRRLTEDQLRAALQEQARALAETTRERERAERAEISALLSVSQARRLSHDHLGALLAAVKGGRRLATIDGTLPLRVETVFALWQALRTVREKNRLVGHHDWVLGARFSPDGCQLVSASDDGTARVWSAAGEPLATLAGHRGSVLDAVFSPDGRLIATASDDRTLRLWTVAGEPLQTLNGHEGSVNNVAFSPSGQVLATASNDATLKLWTVSGRLVRTFNGHSDWVRSVAFSPDGDYLVSGSEDGTVRLWRTDGELVQTMLGHSSWVLQVTFSPDGQLLASGGGDGTVRLWNLEGQLIETFEGHSNWVRSVAFSPNGQTLASAGDDQVIHLWSLEGLITQTLRGHRSSVLSVNFSPQGDRLVSASDDDTIRIWQTAGYPETLCEGHRGIVWDVCWQPGGNRLLTGGADDTARLWDSDGNLLKTLGQHHRSVYGVAWSPDGQLLATASADATVSLWSPEGLLIRTLTDHTEAVWAVDISPDGQLIATAGSDRTVRLWRRNGKCLQVWRGHEGTVWSVAFSPDGQHVISASEDGTVRLWHVKEGLVQKFSGHSGGVWDAGFNPSGQRVASAGSDGTVRLWDLNGRQRKMLRGHRDWVRSVAFSPDGELLASASDDETLRLWSAGGEALQSFAGHQGIVWRVDFDGEGHRLASASADGTVRIWNLELEDLIRQGCRWLGDYLQHNATLSEEDRNACP
ncbi:MAG: AAA family ATPase [Cyanobacteria bacterium J06554_6]